MANAGMLPAATVLGKVDDQLRALLARGFRFVDPRDERGDVVAVVGVRAYANVVDVVQLHGEDDAIVTRMPADQDPLAPSQLLLAGTRPGGGRAGQAAEHGGCLVGAVFTVGGDHRAASRRTPVINAVRWSRRASR